MKSGSLDGLTPQAGELPGIILGSRLAEKIGAVVGQAALTLVVPNGDVTPFGAEAWISCSLRVAGTFESGFYEIDTGYAFMSLADTQKAFDLDDVVNSIELELDDITRRLKWPRPPRPIIGPKLTATTWEEQNGQMLGALKMDDW